MFINMSSDPLPECLCARRLRATLLPHTICGHPYILRRTCGVIVHADVLVGDSADLDYLFLFTPLHPHLLPIHYPYLLTPALQLIFSYVVISQFQFLSLTQLYRSCSHLIFILYSNPRYPLSLSLFQTHSPTHLSRLSPPFSVSLLFSLCPYVTRVSLCLSLAPFSLYSSLRRHLFLSYFHVLPSPLYYCLSLHQPLSLLYLLFSLSRYSSRSVCLSSRFLKPSVCLSLLFLVDIFLFLYLFLDLTLNVQEACSKNQDERLWVLLVGLLFKQHNCSVISLSSLLREIVT